MTLSLFPATGSAVMIPCGCTACFAGLPCEFETGCEHEHWTVTDDAVWCAECGAQVGDRVDAQNLDLAARIEASLAAELAGADADQPWQGWKDGGQ